MSDRKNKEKEKVMSVRDRMGLFQTNNTTAPLRPNSGVSRGKAKEALKINTPLPSPAEPITREYLNPHHFEIFFKTLSSMKDEGFLLDITMPLGSDAYKVHSLVLAAVSPSVCRWFKSGGLDHTFSETVEPTVMFLDDKMTQLGIKAVVDFAYTGDVHVDVSNSIVEVLEACSWLEVDRLSQVCSWILDPPEEEKTYQPSSSRERQETFRAIQDLWEKGIGCDVRVQSDGHSFKAHRVALAAGGDFFRAMFSSGMKESLETTVHLPCLSSPVLSSLLRFIYSGAVLLSWGNVFEITEAALLYQVGGLLQLCLDFLQIEINEEHCLDCMALAEAYDLVELKDFVEQYILSNFEQVASVPKFQDLTEVQLVYFLDKDSLCVTSEVEVFKIVLLWVEEDINCRLEWVEDLMKRVRFPLMSPKELKEVQRAKIMRTNQGCKELLNRAIASLRPKPGTKPVTCKPRTPNQVLVLIGGDHLNNDFSRRLPSNRLWFAHKFFNGVGLVKHIDWRPLSTIPDIPRFRHAVAVLNNQLYIFGGSWYYGERDILKSVVRYHPSHDSWEHLPDMNESRNYFAVVCVDGAMYAMGGNVDNTHILDSVECYTPGDNTWRWRPKSQRLTTGEPHQCRSDVWMYEPKLAYPKGNADEMQEDRELFDTQAMDGDYKDSGYTRGHLNPNSHQWDGFSQCSTFTMTNIVPQHKKSNSPPWSDHENKILKRLEQYCKSDAYIVTGVMPYINDKWIQKGNLRRVAIPEYLWSAYCCREFTNGRGQEHLFPTFAVRS